MSFCEFFNINPQWFKSFYMTYSSYTRKEHLSHNNVQQFIKLNTLFIQWLFMIQHKLFYFEG